MYLIRLVLNRLAKLGIIEGRRYCSVCQGREYAESVGELQLCQTVIDKKTVINEAGEAYSTLSHACLVLPDVCQRCNHLIRYLRRKMRHIEAEYRTENGIDQLVAVIATGEEAIIVYSDPNTPVQLTRPIRIDLRGTR